MRLRVEGLERRTLLSVAAAADVAALALELIDLDGEPGLVAGESFAVAARFRETGTAAPLFAGYADVLFDPARLRVDAVVHDADYQFGRSGAIDNARGVVEEVGATGPLTPPGEATIFTLQMTALAEGTTSLRTNAAEGLAAEVVRYGVAQDDRARTAYGALDLRIDLPAVTLAASATNLAEEGGTSTVTATLSRTTSRDVVVSLGYTGEAAAESDFTAPSQIVIPQGSRQGSIVVTARDDQRLEGPQRFTVSITAAAGAVPGSGTQAEMTILDDETVELAFKTAASSVAEAAGSAQVEVQLVGPGVTLDVPVTVNITDSGTGTAASGTDYQFLATTMTFGPGTQGGAVQRATLSVAGDNLIEESETVVLALSGVTGPGAKIGSPASHTLTIAEPNRPPTLALIDAVNKLDESQDTSSRIPIAKIVVSDDGQGTNRLTLAGEDAASFEIDGSHLYLKAGAVLDAAAAPTLDVAVQVDDPTLGDAPDDARALAIPVLRRAMLLDYYQEPALNLAAGPREYRIRPRHGGVLTIIVEPVEDAGSARIDITDDEGRALASSREESGPLRLDYPAADAAAHYVVRILGTSAQADLTMLNLVQHDPVSRTLTVHGTAQADLFGFEPGPAAGQWLVSVRGAVYDQFNQENTGSISFLGGEGADEAQFVGTAETETVTMRPGELQSASASLNLHAIGVERNSFAADAADSLELFDSPAIDRLSATKAGTITLADLGESYRLVASQFGAARLHASGQVGVRDNADRNDDWGDFATLADSAGQEVFHGFLGGTSTFSGPAFNYAIDGFHTVKVVSSHHGPRHGADEAWFHLEPRAGLVVAEQFQSSAIARAATLGDATLTEEGDVRDDYNGPRVRTDDFVEVTVLGDLTAADQDRAYLMGSGRNERFSANPANCTLDSPEADGARWFRVTATGLKGVYAAGKGGTSDLAEFTGTPGLKEIYTQTQRYGRLAFADAAGLDHLARAFRFDQYRIAASDLLDVANLCDTSKADTLTAGATGLLLETPFWQARIDGFARVVAEAQPDRHTDRALKRGAVDYLHLTGDWEEIIVEDQ